MMPRVPGPANCADGAIKFVPVMVLVSASILPAPPAAAANWLFEARATTGLTATSNSGFAGAGREEDDVIVDLTPSFVIRGEGRRLRVSGSAAMTTLTYVNGSQGSAFAPTAAVNANLEAIERFLFLEGALGVTQQAKNPFAPRPDGVSSFNRQTQTQARLSPYVERSLPGELSIAARWDNTWTKASDGTTVGGESYSARYSARLERRPLPLGWAMEAERVRTDYKDATTPTPDVDIARLRVRYAPSEQWVLGVRAGHERSDLFVPTEKSRSFGGAEVAWRPSERTRFDGFWEDRSFGSGWQAAFDHRMPQLAINASFLRDLTSSASPLLSVPAGGSIAALLDAAFTTRISDPIERARAVEDFLARQGLPRSFDGATTIFVNRIVLRTSRNLTLTWIGRRTTVAVNAYDSRDQTPTDSAFVALPGSSAVSIAQQGGGVTLSRRISSVTSLAAAATFGRARGALSTAAGEWSRQQTYRLQTDHQLGPRTTAFGGVRWQESSSSLIDSSHEAAFFTGLSHRF